jgi:hypothetical protein
MCFFRTASYATDQSKYNDNINNIVFGRSKDMIYFIHSDLLWSMTF